MPDTQIPDTQTPDMQMTAVRAAATELPAVPAAPPASQPRVAGQRRGRRIAVFVAVALGAALMFFPFFWTIVTSIQKDDLLATPSVIPTHVTLDGYRKLFAAFPFGRAALNSMGLAVASMLFQLVTSSMAAYVFARIDFRGRRVVFVLYLTTQMIPLQVLIVPLFVEMRHFHLIDSYAALLAPTVASAFGVFLLTQAMRTVPIDLDEAAVLDGAGHIRIFWRVILPLVRPALATFAVFAFMTSWNSFLWPLVVTRTANHMTLPLGLATLQGQFTTEWNVVMAGSVLSVLPIVIVYAFTQRFVVQSVATTGFK